MIPQRLHLLKPGSLSDRLTPGDEAARKQAAQQVAELLGVGLCPPDFAFDRFLPHALQVISDQFWTPLAVANRAAAWFRELNVRTVVDIGSGAGKFCVATALAGPYYFTGLEQRARLVTVARALAQVFGVDDRVCFVEGTLGKVATPVADAYYFYNPFGENLHPEYECLDKDVELGSGRYVRDVCAAENLLLRAPVGTYILTYNGFGGRVPSGYDEIRVARDLPNVLRMWKKTREKHRPLDDTRNRIAARAKQESFARSALTSSLICSLDRHLLAGDNG